MARTPHHDNWDSYLPLLKDYRVIAKCYTVLTLSEDRKHSLRTVRRSILPVLEDAWRYRIYRVKYRGEARVTTVTIVVQRANGHFVIWERSRKGISERHY